MIAEAIAKVAVPADWILEEFHGRPDLLVIERPNHGGFVTVDTKNRFFAPGYATPHRNFAPDRDWTVYVGTGWLQRLIKDAVDWLDTTMN